MQCLSVMVKILIVQNTSVYLTGELVKNYYYVAQ